VVEVVEMSWREFRRRVDAARDAALAEIAQGVSPRVILAREYPDGYDSVRFAVRATPEAWRLGIGGGNQPIPWSQIPRPGLDVYAWRSSGYLHRYPGLVEALGGWGSVVRRGRSVGFLYWRGVCVFEPSYAPPEDVLRVDPAVGPRPDGWIVKNTRSGCYRWCGPDVWAAIQRLRDHRPGGLLLTRSAVAAYGRDEQAGYGRLRGAPMGTRRGRPQRLCVPVCDELSEHLDDLAFVLRVVGWGSVPDSAMRVDASLIRRCGGLVLVADAECEPGVLLWLRTRHGAGWCWLPPEATVRTGAFHTPQGLDLESLTCAFVRDGGYIRHDLAGYRYAEGQAWRVTGLAEGQSEKQEVIR